MRFIGVDESGRCPALGSLFLASVCFRKKDLKGLDQIKECKSYLREQIPSVFNKIKNRIDWKLEELTAQDISKAKNLNDLQMFRACRMIESFILKYGTNLTLIIDNWEVSRKAFMNRLKIIDLHLFNLIRNRIIKLYLVHNCERIKYSLKYKAIALASIIAKYHRDKQMILLDKKYKIGFGSPNEWRTRNFILKCINHELNEEACKHVRWNWQTVDKVKLHPNWYKDGKEEWYNKTKKLLRESRR